jgi:hypothetical protein
MSKRSKSAGAAKTAAPPPPAAEVHPETEPWAVDEALCGEQELPAHDDIAARAREIWASRGKPVGEDLDIWLEAQREFLAVR